MTITLYPEGTTEQDVKITWPADTNTRDNVWLTIDLGPGRPTASLNIIRTEEGVIFDVYALANTLAETSVNGIYVFDTDIIDPRLH